MEFALGVSHTVERKTRQWTFTHWASERRANPGGHEGKFATTAHPSPADVSAAWDIDS